MTSASVLVPVRNGMAHLPSLLDAIEAQVFSGQVEIVATDDRSTDGSGVYLRSRGVRVVCLRAGEFHHAGTRNRLASIADCENLVFLVQDALPVGSHWLAELLRPLSENPDVVGAFSRQRARPNAPPWIRAQLETWIAGTRQSRIARMSAEEYDALSPAARLDRCAFDNVSSCIRRSALLAHPFPEVPMGEDVAWAKAALLRGHAIAFAAASEVLHSHDRSAWYEFRRTWKLHSQLAEQFGMRNVDSVQSLLYSLGSGLRDHGLGHLRLGSRLALRGAGVSVAWSLGQFAGSLAKPPGSLGV